MARQPNSITRANEKEAPNKQQLERQIGRTRESLAETVEEIKETAEQGYASVKQTVSGVLDYREEFQKDPLVWSLGALSAGFALGYAVGYAHKFSTKKAKNSQVAQFTDRMVNEVSKLGQSLVVPALGTKMREFFGFDFGELLRDMSGSKKSRPRKRATATRRLRSGARTSTGPKRSKKRK
jgi:hypothetical protein